VFVTHGGLFNQEGVTLDDIREIKRNCQPPDAGIMTDLLWADPHLQQGRGPSKRGVGLCFGPDITAAFLKLNGLKMVVRSHEVKDQGYEVIHDGKLVTIFSAPNYCDNVGNKGAWIRFGPDCEPKFTQFTAVAHPDIKPMAYQSQAYR
jgi:serine/threonine-protein phosphatase 5